MKLLFLLIQVLFLRNSCWSEKILQNNEDVGELYLAINPLAFEDEEGNIIKRRLEINWYGVEVTEGDLINLEGPNWNTLSIAPFEYSDGFYISQINLPYPSLDEMGFTNTCVFGFNATWTRADGSFVATSCLKNEPSWMWDKRDDLQYMNIGEMMLVGSHDAGAYRDYQGVGDDNPITSSVFAQEEDLLHQLIWGVRFLGIRVGFYPTSEERFWLVHGIIKTHSMSDGIEDVQLFLKNTREIVIWEIHAFEQSWDTSSHEEYKSLLLSEFGEWLVVPGELGWKTPINEIWQQEGLAEGQGRIIIIYNNEEYTDTTLFFPEVLFMVGDQNEPEELKAYLTAEVANAENNPSYQPWRPNCQMTPSPEDIILGRWHGLREMADAVNRNVTRWWRDDWPDLPATFPTFDFIKGTNMVQESIERNIRLAKKLRLKYI